MRHLGPVVAALAFSAVIALASVAAQAQQKSAPKSPPPPPAQQKSAPAPQPPPQAPPKPYKPVAVTLPNPVNDASFEAFRKEIVAVAQKKDRAALARLVVAKGFFWEREDGKAAPKKSGADILSQALNLPAKDGSGWEALAGFASDATAAPLPERKEVLCAPADPTFDERELEGLAQSTETDPGDWGYPTRADVEVRETPNATAPVIEKLGLHFVRVLDDESPNAANTAGEWLRVVAPSGKVGFIQADALASLSGAQLCYLKEGTAWKITGIIGGGG
jgi:hypothetical protein